MSTIEEAVTTNNPWIASDDVHSLSDQVYEYLTDQIIRGAISYGDKLNIKRIAAQLKMSSMPIRDAIKRLEQEKVVVVKPRSNCFVRTPTKRNTLDTIDARRMLEVFAVSQVYPRVTPSELRPLEDLLDAMHAIVFDASENADERQLKRYIDLDRQFHTELCALARNEYIDRFYREVCMHLSMSSSYGIGICHGLEPTFREHEALVHHLHSRSPEAVAVIGQHLLQSKKNIVEEPTFRSLPD